MISKEYDIVVVGGGGSGLVAAARAAELGMHVVVLEKTKILGGGMLFASTMRTFRSQWQKERGIADVSNPFLRSMMDLTLWQLDPELARNIVFGTGKFFDWYSRYEKPEVLAKYEPRPYAFDFDPATRQDGPQIDVFHNGSGRFIVETMKRRLQELGVELLTETPAVDVEVTDGRITAVIAEHEGEQLRFGCRACILASAAWIMRKDIINEVLPAYNDADVLPSAHLNPAYTGDALTFGEKAGAYIDRENFCLRIMGPICALGDRCDLDLLTHLDSHILVDLSGKRFIAEPMAPRIDPFETGNILVEHPKARTFFIFSRNELEQEIAASQSNAAVREIDVFAMPPLPPLEEITAMFTRRIERGSHELAIADTVEELAEKLGLDPAVLKKTVEDYNASCEAGLDWQCYKEPEKMIPLSEGPYYGFAGKLSTDGAFGGILVNPQLQAKTADGKGVVDGLYVVGDAASGRHISLHGMKKQFINDMSFALSSGFLAGANAAEALKAEQA